MWSEMLKPGERKRGLFISLKDGDEVTGVFMGEPHVFYQSWSDKTEYPQPTGDAKFRFRINFLVKNEDIWGAKIFSGGITLSEQILDQKEEFGLDCLYKLKRKGSGKDDTRYFIVMKKALLNEEIEELKKIPINKLEIEEKTPF